MFDIGAAELLVIIIVAILVIGPKEMPRAMRTAGRWIGQIRRVSAHFRTGLDAMVREAELEDMEQKWKAQNEEIMRRSAINAQDDAGEPVMTGPPPIESDAAPDHLADDPPLEEPQSSQEHVSNTTPEPKSAGERSSPELPLPPRGERKE